MKLQVGVKALIRNDKDEYLFLQRAEVMDDDDTIRWDLPGGRIESDEPLLDGLKREIYEETGLQITQSPTLLEAQDIFVSTKDIHVVRLIYTVYTRGTVILSDEHRDTRWMTLETAQGLPLGPYLSEFLTNKNMPS